MMFAGAGASSSMFVFHDFVAHAMAIIGEPSPHGPYAKLNAPERADPYLDNS